MKIFFILTNIIFFATITSVQVRSDNSPDVLQAGEKSYSFYEEYFSDRTEDAVDDLLRAKQWIAKAKREKRYSELLKAYKVIMFKDNEKNLMAYADTIVYYSKFTSNNSEIGNAYLSKGVIYYKQKDIVLALENYILADQYISQTSDLYLIHKMKYVIAQAKYYLGFYDEAIALLNQCESYFQTENDKAFLSTLHLLALCHTSKGNYEIAVDLIKMGIEECNLLSLQNMLIYFQRAQAINNYYLKNYKIAISQLNNLAIHFGAEKNESELILNDFYTAKCYWMLNEKTKALPYLFKMDMYLANNMNFKPEFRETYEMLFEYYEDKNNLQLQIKYINKLRILDQILTSKYKHLSKTIQKKYDTAKLIKMHKTALNKSNRNKLLAYLVSICAFITVIVLIYRNYKSKKKYLNKFNQLMQSQENTVHKSDKQSDYVDISDLNLELVENILKNLEKFETGKKYLQENMNLTLLAKELQTNTKYTSRVILKYRGKKTVDYTNDLKVNYIIEMLKTQPKFRKYTTAALGDEGGFGSAQNFTRAFKNATTLTPMYFINQLNQSQNSK